MADAPLHAILNSIGQLAGNVYPLTVPQDAVYPAATYQRISTVRASKFHEDSTVVNAVYQVDLYGRHTAGRAPLLQLAGLVLAVLQRAKDPSTTPPIYDVFIEAERDDFEDSTELWLKSYDIRIWYGEL